MASIASGGSGVPFKIAPASVARVVRASGEDDAMDEPEVGSGGAGSDFEHPPSQPSESDERQSANVRYTGGEEKSAICPEYGRLSRVPSNAIKRAGIEMS